MYSASQANTLQLDLEQLVMKANKLNDCSHSCSSSPCSTSATDKLLGQPSEKLPKTKLLSCSTTISTTTTAKHSSNNFKLNYYDKYLDRFANLIDNYKNTTTSSLENVAIKPVFYGNVDALNDIFQHDQFNFENSINPIIAFHDFEWEKRHFIKSPSDINKYITKNYRTNNTSNTDIEYDFLIFTDTDYSKFEKNTKLQCVRICFA